MTCFQMVGVGITIAVIEISSVSVSQNVNIIYELHFWEDNVLLLVIKSNWYCGFPTYFPADL